MLIATWGIALYAAVDGVAGVDALKYAWEALGSWRCAQSACCALVLSCYGKGV